MVHPPRRYILANFPCFWPLLHLVLSIFRVVVHNLGRYILANCPCFRPFWHVFTLGSWGHIPLGDKNLGTTAHASDGQSGHWQGGGGGREKEDGRRERRFRNVPTEQELLFPTMLIALVRGSTVIRTKSGSKHRGNDVFWRPSWVLITLLRAMLG